MSDYGQLGVSTLDSLVLQFLAVYDSPFSTEEEIVAALEPMRRAVSVREHAISLPDHDDCPDCRATGKWANGLQCNRCAGKGYQTTADKRRNTSYDSRHGRFYRG